MISSLITSLFFVAGIILGVSHLLPPQLLDSDLSQYALYFLIFFVGVSIGGDKKTWQMFRNFNLKIILIPLIVIIGSLAGTRLLSLFFNDFELKESLAVGAGFGYYSLSSIIITKFHSETLGVVALMSNMIRELLTLIFTPLLKKYFGKLAPIAAGGATTMDTTLPVITLTSGKDYGLIAVFSGVILSILVPILVTFIITR